MISSTNARAYRFTLPFACLLVLLACGTEPEDTRGLLFEGTITDADTGAPIPGTGVGVADGSGFGLPTSLPATSDAQGHYTLTHDGCINNPYLDAYATGYYFYSTEVVCKAERQTVNVSLTRDPTAP
jgi:hypothetical protein